MVQNSLDLEWSGFQIPFEIWTSTAVTVGKLNWSRFEVMIMCVMSNGQYGPDFKVSIENWIILSGIRMVGHFV